MMNVGFTTTDLLPFFYEVSSVITDLVCALKCTADDISHTYTPCPHFEGGHFSRSVLDGRFYSFVRLSPRRTRSL